MWKTGSCSSSERITQKGQTTIARHKGDRYGNGLNSFKKVSSPRKKGGNISISNAYRSSIKDYAKSKKWKTNPPGCVQFKNLRMEKEESPLAEKASEEYSQTHTPPKKNTNKPAGCGV